MHNRLNGLAAAVGFIAAGAVALAGCVPDSKLDPKAQVDKPAATLDLSMQSWAAVHLSIKDSSKSPDVIRLCHVSPTIQEDLTVTLIFDETGDTYAGAGRVVRSGPGVPIGDVELQVDDRAAHHIPPATNPTTRAVWPQGSSALVVGPEARVILLEMEDGATVRVKESGMATARSFSTKDLAQAIAECAKP